MFLRKMALLAKIQPVIDVDAVPVGAVDAMLVGNVELTPVEGEEVERPIVQPYFGSVGSVMVTRYSKMAFDVELAGVDAPGEAAPYKPLLLGCSMSEALTVGVEATYTPITAAAPPMLTLYPNIDGVLYKALNAKGTVKATVNAKGIPVMRFEFTGSFNPATDTALPVVDYASFQAPKGVNKANTTLAIDGYAAACSAFEFDVGNVVVKRDLINVDKVEIVDRKSIGSVTFEHTSVATKNWIAMAEAKAKVPVALVHGTGASNIVEINANLAEIGKPSFGESDGIQMITLPLKYVPTSAGNDEWEIVVR